MQARQSTRKNPGGKTKPPSSLVLSTSLDPEDATEPFGSSSPCSPLDDSPTENKVHFEVSEEGPAVNVGLYEKLKLLKSRRKKGTITGHNHSIMGSQFGEPGHSLLEHDDDISNVNQAGDDTLSAFHEFQDYEQQVKTENGRYNAGATTKKYDAAEIMGRDIQPRRPPHSGNIVYRTGQEPANGSFETILLETIGGNIVVPDGQEIGATKRTSFLLSNDVGLDDDYGDESEAFESRGTCQDDTASLYSDSGLSAEADTFGSSQVDQNKKVRSSSSQPHRDRK